MEYRLTIVINDNGYFKVDGNSDMPCFVVDRFKKTAREIANEINKAQKK